MGQALEQVTGQAAACILTLFRRDGLTLGAQKLEVSVPTFAKLLAGVPVSRAVATHVRTKISLLPAEEAKPEEGSSP
jgi:hypothetical protein